MRKKSVFAASCIVAGNGIGSGVMAIPYFVSRAGIVWAAVAFAAAFIVSILLHMMIAEILLQGNKENDNDILEAFSTYLFKGKLKGVMTMGFFILMVVVLVSNLAAYISGTSEILRDIVPVPEAVVRIIFYAVCAVIVLLGLRSVGFSEKITVGFMCFLLLPTVIVSFMHRNGSPLLPGGIAAFAAVFSMIMFSFSAIFAVPQIIELLQRDTVKIRKSIIYGIGMNLLMSVAVAVCALVSSAEVTQIAIIGWAEAVGGVVRILGSVFIVCAMMTSFWSIGFAATEMVRIRTKLAFPAAFCIATLPSLIITFIISNKFMNYMKIAGGAVAVIISLMVIPTYLLCMRGRQHQVLTKAGSSKPAVVFVFLMYIVMAVGSFI